MKAWAYYNEIDPFAAAWLWELQDRNLIAPGEIDTRSIEDVTPDDLKGFTQCHFFAGIGGWSYALRLAGWPDDQEVWTGSCPCQPFSAAGKRGGLADERHLWPVWFPLIAIRRPAVVFGEQVASPDGIWWWQFVSSDLEDAGYAVGIADLCAAGVGAPHIRQRLYFVADADGRQSRHREIQRGGKYGLRTQDRHGDGSARDAEQSETGFVADSLSERRSRERLLLRPEETGRDAGEVPEAPRCGGSGELADCDGSRRRARRSGETRDGRDAAREQSAGLRHACQLDQSPSSRRARLGAQPAYGEFVPTGEGRDFWADCDWILCRDGKYRPVEPGTFPLAHGVPARVGRLRGYGNAIVPELAAAFIQAYEEAR